MVWGVAWGTTESESWVRVEDPPLACAMGCWEPRCRRRGAAAAAHSICPRSSPVLFLVLGDKPSERSGKRGLRAGVLVGNQGPLTPSNTAFFPIPVEKEQSNPQIIRAPSQHWPPGKIVQEMETPLDAAGVGRLPQTSSSYQQVPGSLVGKSHFTPGVRVPSIGHLTSASCGVWFSLASRPSRRTQEPRVRKGLR